MKSYIFAGLLAIGLSASAMAQDSTRIVIAADSSSGTYNKMLGEIIGVCASDQFEIVPATDVHGGAPGNLDALINNKAQAAFLHSDVFFAQSQADPSYKRFQTLVALHPEPIHVLALRQSKTAKDGIASFGKKDINKLSDAKGAAVCAAGGGVYTARILQAQGEAGFTVLALQSGPDVIKALQAGQCAAGIFVGAAPLPNIAPLSPAEFKLIPIGEEIASRVKGVYRPATINYNGLTQGPIATLAPMATLVTRKYSTQEKLKAQRHFRQCFNDKLDDLKDNGSPSWQQVEANDHGVLDWYEIPAATSTTPTLTTAPNKR